MPAENLTIKLLEQQIAEVEKRLAENRALLHAEEENLKKLQQEKNPSLNPSDTVEKTGSVTPEHPAFEKIDARLQTIETKLSGTLSTEQKKAFEQEKRSLLRQKDALTIALDPTKNDIEKIGLILENGIDNLCVGKNDFDTEISTILFEKARKNGKNINIEKKKRVTEKDSINTFRGVNIQVDRGGKNDIGIEVTDSGSVIITIDHHEMHGAIEPTSAAEGTLLLLEKLRYDWNFVVKSPDGKSQATITKQVLESIVDLVNKEDNLTYTYTLDELLTTYPASLPGILQNISPYEALRLAALHPDILAPFPEKLLKEKILLKNQNMDTLEHVVAKQRDNYEDSGKGIVRWNVENFEIEETKSLERWEPETSEFGTTLLLSASALSIPSKIAYAKGYDTLAIFNEEKGTVSFFSKEKDISILAERMQQKYPQTIFPRARMVLLLEGDARLTIEEIANMLGLKEKKSPTTEPTPIHTEFRAGDSIGAHGKTEQPFPTPRNTTFASEPPTIKENPESIFDTNEVIQPKKEKPKLFTAKELRRQREERFGKPFDDTTKQ